MLDLSPAPGDLEPIETASRDEITALQLERLRWTLRRAYENVPFYRRRFDEAGVHPEDCRELADLASYPFTVKQDFRDNYPFGLLAVPRNQVARVHGSSGTTGKPTVVGYTLRDVDIWADLVARSIRASGGRATGCTSRTATGCSPAGWARTTAPSGWAARSSRSPGA
jgi:phenylacetate-CoA ligase